VIGYSKTAVGSLFLETKRSDEKVQRRIVVTGVAGFVGSNLAKHLLRNGYAVVGLDDLSAGTLENVDERVEFHESDIRSQEIYALFDGVDAVFHLAAKTSLVDCLNKPLEAASMNVTGTLNVLEAARKAKVGKFVYADTSAEYEGIHEFPTPEDRIQPIGVYAASKHGGATFCESYRRLYGMNVAMVRYFNVYGPAQDWRRVVPPVMSSFIIRMLQGERPLIYGDGEKRRDFIYVDDVNDLHVVILEDDRADGRVFNIGAGANYSVNEIYELVEGLLKHWPSAHLQARPPGRGTNHPGRHYLGKEFRLESTDRYQRRAEANYRVSAKQGSEDED
jgi:UDP-glucose 4-epimerase